MNFIGPYSDLPYGAAMPVSRPGRHTDVRKVSPAEGFPLSLEELKADLRVDSSDEDDTIMRMARAAATLLEARTGCAALAGRYEANFNDWCVLGPWEFHRWPLRAVTEIAWIDLSKSPPAWTAVDLAQFYILERSRSFLVQPLNTFRPPVINAPFSGVRVRFTAGFDVVLKSGDDQESAANDDARIMDEGMRTLLTALTAHYYANRELFAAERGSEIEAGAGSILNAYRKFW